MILAVIAMDAWVGVSQGSLALVSVGALIISTRLAMTRNNREETEREGKVRDMVDDHDRIIKGIQDALADTCKVLNEHLIDCAEERGEAKIELRSLNEHYARLNRNIEQLQSQIRLKAVGAHDTLFKTDT